MAKNALKFWTVAIFLTCGMPDWLILVWSPWWIAWLLTVGVLPRQRHHFLLAGRYLVEHDRIITSAE